MFKATVVSVSICLLPWKQCCLIIVKCLISYSLYSKSMFVSQCIHDTCVCVCMCVGCVGCVCVCVGGH